MGRTLRVVGAAGFLVAGVGLATASPSAAEPAATIDSIELDECDIVVTFTVEDAGRYDLEVWDDGEQIGDVAVEAEEGATVQGRYTITAVVQQGASGLGITIASPDGDAEFDTVDPYNGADDIIDFCASQSTTTTTGETTTTVSPTTAPPANHPEPTPPPATPVEEEPPFTG